MSESQEDVSYPTLSEAQLEYLLNYLDGYGMVVTDWDQLMEVAKANFSA